MSIREHLHLSSNHCTIQIYICIRGVHTNSVAFLCHCMSDKLIDFDCFHVIWNITATQNRYPHWNSAWQLRCSCIAASPFEIRGIRKSALTFVQTIYLVLFIQHTFLQYESIHENNFEFTSNQHRNKWIFTINNLDIMRPKMQYYAHSEPQLLSIMCVCVCVDSITTFFFKFRLLSACLVRVK